MTFQYYDRQDTREPVRIDFAVGDSFSASWQWWEFDASSQDPSLFVIDAAILEQCNSVTGAEAHETVAKKPVKSVKPKKH